MKRCEIPKIALLDATHEKRLGGKVGRTCTCLVVRGKGCYHSLYPSQSQPFLATPPFGMRLSECRLWGLFQAISITQLYSVYVSVSYIRLDGKPIYGSIRSNRYIGLDGKPIYKSIRSNRIIEQPFGH